MQKWVIACAGLAVMVAHAAYSDTIYLNTGVQFDAAVVQENADGSKVVKAGNRTITYRAEEIARIEKNDKTGKFDKEAAKARWAQIDAEITASTGLNATQRSQIEVLLFQIQRGEDAQRLDARDRLVALQKEMDVFSYLVYQLPSIDYVSFPYILEVMFLIDPGRTLPHLRENAANAVPGARAKAIELLGRVRDVESVGLVARGLVDAVSEVRIMAAYALANLSAKQATPALLEEMKLPDLRVANASREALQALWKNELGEQKPQSVSEWIDFWNAHAAEVSQPIDYAALEPLTDPQAPFVAG